MVNVSLLDDRAVFEVEGLDRLWALRSRIDIPLTHIADVEFDPDQVSRWWWHGWKLQKLILEVADPERVVTQLRASLQR